MIDISHSHAYTAQLSGQQVRHFLFGAARDGDESKGSRPETGDLSAARFLLFLFHRRIDFFARLVVSAAVIKSGTMLMEGCGREIRKSAAFC